MIAVARVAPAKCRSGSFGEAGSSAKRKRRESASIRLASSRECAPSPGPYSAIMRGCEKSILPATRSTSALELGMMDAI